MSNLNKNIKEVLKEAERELEDFGRASRVITLKMIDLLKEVENFSLCDVICCEPKVGYIYYVGSFTAPKVFNGLYYECLLTDQRVASHTSIVKDTETHLKDWEHEIYKPERFGL